MEKATFAGGCFWCMVSPFEELPGIGGIVSGYSGGHVENPTYEQVKTGTTGHFEVVEITYDPELFPYERLLELFWQQIDPTDPDGQFQDRGPQYRTAIFYHNEKHIYFDAPFTYTLVTYKSFFETKTPTHLSPYYRYDLVAIIIERG